jgi:hypothetical protein
VGDLSLSLSIPLRKEEKDWKNRYRWNPKNPKKLEVNGLDWSFVCFFLGWGRRGNNIYVTTEEIDD